MVETVGEFTIEVFPGDLAVVQFGRGRGLFWAEVERADDRKMVSDDGSKMVLYLAVLDCFC
jgi:hypothetical protein